MHMIRGKASNQHAAAATYFIIIAIVDSIHYHCVRIGCFTKPKIFGAKHSTSKADNIFL